MMSSAVCARARSPVTAHGVSYDGPDATAGSLDHERKARPDRAISVPKRVRQSAQKRLHDDAGDVRVEQWWPAHRLTDLLMVHPVLGEVPRGVQPHRSWFGPSP